MQSSQIRPRTIVAATLAALLIMIGGGWWFCGWNSSTAFLPKCAGAEWIMDSAPAENSVRMAVPVPAVFTRSFTLETLPADATLIFRAFKEASISINGHVPGGLDAGTNWKLPTKVSVANLLRTGTNEITVCVTNTLAPPALWLRLQAGTVSLSSDESWRVSVAGAAWQNAHPAFQPVAFPDWSPLYDDHRTSDSLRKTFRELCAVSVAALGLILVAGLWFSRRREGQGAAGLIYVLFGFIVVGRVALFVHDMPDLDRRVGFDALYHIQYIKFIQQNGALPAPQEGWEMHQPPLYYLVSSWMMSLCGVSADKADSTVSLRAVNGVLGLIHCWLVLLCLRRIFPNNFAAQAVGLLTAALLPAHLYLSMYVTNDPLTGLLVTMAFYFLLRVLQSEKENVWYYMGAGLALGAAMLTKLSALPAVPIFFLVLGLRLVLRQNISRREALQGIGLAAILCLAVCIWHYERVWKQTGALAVPSSEATDWWQDPGFRTASYYLHFGHALISPLFSGDYSFADGIYSTLWGDGLISGAGQLAYRPPWNYDLMYVGYLFSLPMTILAFIGVVFSIGRYIRRGELEWFTMPAVLLAYLMAMIFLTISAPWLAEVKAFYAFPALMPLCAMVAAGWNWLAGRNRALRILLWLAVLLWTFTSYASFWIRGNHYETFRSRAITQTQTQHFNEAAANFGRALQLNPDDATSHYLLAETLKQQGKSAAAIQEYNAALAIRADSPEILNVLAQMLATGQKEDIERALKLAHQACELTGYRRADMVYTLALAEANAGLTNEAMSTAEQAHRIATQRDETSRARQIQRLIDRLRANKAD